MMPSPKTALATSLLATILTCNACGDPPIDATLTSRIVQHDTCEQKGEQPETCEQTERFYDVVLRLVETDDGRVWLRDVPNASGAFVAVLGTRDSGDGFLFEQRTNRTSNAGECKVEVVERWALHIDEEAAADDVGTDPCIALLGRYTTTTSFSEGCDTLSETPVARTRVERRRFERSPRCDGSDD